MPGTRGLRGILLDMDGVLYNADRILPGAVETVQWLRAQRIPHLFVTNTTSKSRRAIADKLKQFGIPASETEIMTPAAAAVEWLRAGRTGSIALFLRPAAREDFVGLSSLPDDAERGASCVVVGDLGELWDYRTLNRAFRLLHHNPQAELVALGMTRYWLAADGMSLDVAPFVVALEHATGRRARVFGKPAAAFFEAAARELALPAGEILMIGDDIEADIGGAQAAGLKGALVKTGKFGQADLEGTIQPFVVFDSIADLPGWWR